MPQDLLGEREFELINIIGAKLGSNQRDLSRHMELSLGQTNMLMRRLINKGYIRIRQLNKKKVQYILTPKGFAEKMRKSVKYTLNTINSISLIKNRVRDLFVICHKEGHRKFYIYSEADLTMIIERAFHEAHLDESFIQMVESLPKSKLDGVLFIGKEKISWEQHKQEHFIDLIAEVSKQEQLIKMSRG